jgi:hypothetical protein
MEYDQLAGLWWRYWEQPDGLNPGGRYLSYESHPLAGTLGKNQVIRRLRSQHPGRTMLVGDGGSDLEAAGEVDLFVGFGGVAYRKQVAEESPIYIHCQSLAPILPLAMGQVGKTPKYARFWAEGLSHITHEEVTFKDPAQREVFWDALRRGK